MELADYHVPAFEPVPDDEAVVLKDRLRVTVLADRLLRIEFDPDADFEDRPSQTVWYRDQPVPEFEVTEGNLLHVETDHLHLTYDPRRGVESLSVALTDFGTTWRYGDRDGTLGGTTRTLDGVDGPTDLDPGLLARDGWTLLEDTDNLVFGDDGWVTPRDAGEDYEDIYFFGYGHDYLDCLSDFQDIAGDTPMVPRWALGNWWSRYWAYTQSDLRELVERFEAEDLPLSVCVIDMDWHVVDNPYHRGWTGWTWNADLFPDPEGFVDWLHDAGLKTTLNLHPAEGVHAHEDQYEAMAEHMGIDAARQPVEFDASDPRFLRGYFDHVIDPMEDEEGIDFWWIDWQQWKESPRMEGLDPLWALNHLHALDRTRDGRRPFILSRWSGPGNHRYPIEFSGDTVISWRSFAFQPYVTATGGNVGCNYWSHDIGGHFGGTGDPDAFGELYARWTQFGALSPINRIHTSKQRFVDKRPWEFDGGVFDSIADTLRRRHALIPYVYTMARETHDSGVPLCRPLYYHHPEDDAAYHHPQEYYFGSELLAAPHVRPREESTNLSRRAVWLPEGTWFDVDSGHRYEGGMHVRYGDLGDVPLYAKAGAIVPMDADPGFGETDVPDRLRVLLFPGADNEFALYEDDGVSRAYREAEAARTPISQHWEGDRVSVELGPVEGDRSQVPESREVTLQFRGVRDDADVTVDGEREHDRAYDTGTNTLEVTVSGVTPDDDLTVSVDTDDGGLLAVDDRRRAQIEEMLWHFEMPSGAKPRLLESAERFLDGSYVDVDWLGDFATAMTTPQLRAIAETLTGAGFERIRHADIDRLLLFEEGDRADVTYQFATFPRGGIPMDQSGDSRSGRLPTYEVLDLAEHDEDDWELSVSYADVVRVHTDGEDRDPTRDRSRRG